jgi:hypothetical protein
LKPTNSTIAGNHILDCLILLDQVILVTTTILASSTEKISFRKSMKPIFPSACQQVVIEHKEILDPYELTLKTSYGFPISNMSTMNTPDEPTTPYNKSQTATSPKPSTKTKVKYKESIKAISDIHAAMEEDELSVQIQPVDENFQPASTVQPMYFNHRFAI